jgi:hypothetical protein
MPLNATGLGLPPSCRQVDRSSSGGYVPVQSGSLRRAQVGEAGTAAGNNTLLLKPTTSSS